MRRTLATALCAAVVTGLGAGTALAGEVIGPPGTSGGGVQTDTAAPAHANSLCAYSGLNDYNQGQVLTITQNWGQDTRLGIVEGPSPSIGCNPTKSS
jgi:hypothetical protein